jgi:hypothetical protein
MGQQPRRQPNRSLLLVFLFAFPDSLPIENAVFEIDPATPNSRLVESRPANGSGSRSRIQPNQKELCDVLRGRAVGLLSKLELTHVASRAEEMRGLLPRKPPLSGRATLWQDNWRQRNAQARFPMMPNR